MNLTIDNMSYEHLLFMQMRGEKYPKAVKGTTFTAPDFDGEGFNGYILVKQVIFAINDLKEFASLYYEWYSLPLETRSNWSHYTRKETGIAK